MPQQPQLQDAPAEDASAPVTTTAATAPRQEWIEQEPLELPPRPRRRLLTPLPLAMLAVLLIACGFIGGVLVQKGQGSGSSAAGGSGLAGRFAALRGAAGAGGTSAAGAGATGASGAGASAAAGGSSAFARSGSGGITAGQVSYVDGHTLYLTTAEGNTVKVNTNSATSVSKTVSSNVKAIHPGETVSVIGSPGANGEISAETVRVGGAGGLGSLFGGGGAGRGSGGSTGSAAGSAGGGAPALFGNGG